MLVFAVAVFNLVRMRNLVRAAACETPAGVDTVEVPCMDCATGTDPEEIVILNSRCLQARPAIHESVSRRQPGGRSRASSDLGLGSRCRKTAFVVVRFVLDQPETVEFCLCGEREMGFFISSIDPVRGCPFGLLDGCPPSNVPRGVQRCCQFNLAAGTYAIYVSQGVQGGFNDCGHPYQLRITGYTCPSVGVQPMQWSHVKRLCR
jgi:hypothetical protein